jgi:iron complex outermembrane receptor protein
MIQPATSALDALASFTQRLGGDWKVNLTASVFDSRDTQDSGFGSSLGLGGFVGVKAGPGQPPTLVNGGAPIFITVPANYPGNTTGAVQALQVSFPNLYGKDLAESTAYRFNAEITGSLVGWDITVNTGYSESVVDQYITGSINYGNLQAALNSATPYRVGLSSYLNTPAQNAFVAPAMQSQATSKLDYLSLGASRDLFTLPGGTAGLSVGVDLRHEAEDAQATPGVAAGTQPGNDAFAVGNTDVNSVYGEINLPVLKMLEIDASVRYDDYTLPGSFSDTTPKIGFKLTPIDWFTVRGTYAEGFRAPNTNEEGEVGQTFLANSVQDPILCPVAPTAANPNPKGDFQQYCAFQSVYFQGPGKDLQPEKSKSYTFGFILDPIKQFNVSVDYFHIKVDNEITSAFEDPTFDPFTNVARGSPIVASQNTGVGTATTPVLTPVGPIAYLPVPYENVAFTKVEGIDIDAHLNLDLRDAGQLKFELTETHVFHYNQAFGNEQPVELVGTHGPSGIGGDTANPRDRAQLTTTWSRGPWSLSGTVSYVSGYSVTDPTAGLDTCQTAIAFAANGFYANTAGLGTAPHMYCNVQSFTTIDTYGTYQIDKHWQIHASILNLLNQHAPLDLQTYGGGGGTGVFAPYNPSMAQAGAVGRFYNIGATYKF